MHIPQYIFYAVWTNKVGDDIFAYAGTEDSAVKLVIEQCRHYKEKPISKDITVIKYEKGIFVSKAK